MFSLTNKLVIIQPQCRRPAASLRVRVIQKALPGIIIIHKKQKTLDPADFAAGRRYRAEWLHKFLTTLPIMIRMSSCYFLT